MAASFTKTNGTPRECKFCHAHVGYDHATGRVVNHDGTMHSDSCERRKAFFKAEAAIRVQAQRDARFGRQA